MKTLWEWFTGGKAVRVAHVVPTMPAPATHCLGMQEPEPKPRDLSLEIAVAKQEFMNERAAQKAMLVRPRGKYRIRQRYVDHVAAWVVEQWEVWEHPGPEHPGSIYYRAAARMYLCRDYDPAEAATAEQKAELDNWRDAGTNWGGGGRTLAAIRWLPLSPPGSPFRTRKEAQAWLRDWVHPDHCAQEGVMYGADGERMKDPKS